MKLSRESVTIFEKFEAELEEAKVKVLTSFLKQLIALLGKNGFSLVDFVNALCDSFDEELQDKVERHMELVIEEIEKIGDTIAE